MAELNAEIGEPQPIKEMYGILWEDRPGGIATQYMNEKLVSVNICPFEWNIVSVSFCNQDMFDPDARSVLKRLERKNCAEVYVFEKDVFFDNIKVATTGYFNVWECEYYSNSDSNIDSRHIAVYLPEYVANVLPLAKRMKLP